MGRDRQLGSLPTGDVAAHESALGRLSHCLGSFSREVRFSIFISLYFYLKKKTKTNQFIYSGVQIRPTMIKYGINNIRDLVGHKVNLKMVYENSICRIKK